MTDTIESFSALLRTALGDRIEPGADSFLAMLAEDAVMEFPYAPEGYPIRLEGRAAISRYLEQVSGLIVFERMGEPIIHCSADPNLVIIEFDGFGKGVKTGLPYNQSYISVIRTRAGHIVSYRDYWNPLAIHRATGGAAGIDALGMGEAGHA